MNKTKINLLCGANPVENRRERQLSSECKRAFDYLLDWDLATWQYISFQEDEEAQKGFDKFFYFNDLKKMTFIGTEDSGKTAFLQHYFKFNANISYYIDQNTLFFYHSDDGNGVIEAGTGIRSLIYDLKNLCLYLESDRNLFLDIRNYKEFYIFVVRTKKDVLDNPWLKNAEPTEYQKEILKLENNRELSFYLLKLKFFLLNDIKDVKKVVLIFDDIKNEHSYEELGKKVFDCMCNYDSHTYSGYQVKAIFVMHTKVYWLLDEAFKNQFDIAVQKTNLRNTTIFFDVLRKKALDSGEEWMKQQGFREVDLQFAYRTLETLNKKYNQKYQKMILNISQYKKEDILRCYRKIIFNQTWIQKEVFRYDADTYVQNEGFLFTNITCIRALACGDDQVYMNKDISSECLIPNVLYNTPDDDYSIKSLLIIKFFVRNCLEELGHREENILRMFRELFGDEACMFQQTLEYLISRKIVDRFAVSDKDDKRENRLKISPKGSEMWDMFQGDSVLFEISREDYYFFENSGKNMEPSYQLTDSMRQYVIFYELLNMVEEFKKEEDLLYKIVAERGKTGEYKQYFGRKRMSFYLFEGVVKSIDYSSSRDNVRLNEYKRYVECLVNEER